MGESPSDDDWSTFYLNFKKRLFGEKRGKLSFF